MPLQILDIASTPSGTVNEDCAGAAAAMAWVIDGATDVAARRLTPHASDAFWFAQRLDHELNRLAPDFRDPLQALPGRLAETMAKALEDIAGTAPPLRSEHPSAAAFIVRATATGLDYVSLGDCALIARDTHGLRSRIGVNEEQAGDAWVQEEIRDIRAAAPAIDQATARERLWPRLRAARERMNRDDGYGIFSITAPPPHLIRHGHLPLPEGGIVLLASDGLTRLIEVFAHFTSASLLDAAEIGGLSQLIAEVRACETADAGCVRHPRAKTSDDATGLLLRFIPE